MGGHGLAPLIVLLEIIDRGRSFLRRIGRLQPAMISIYRGCGYVIPPDDRAQRELLEGEMYCLSVKSGRNELDRSPVSL
jgi:hypothetical protein